MCDSNHDIKVIVTSHAIKVIVTSHVIKVIVASHVIKVIVASHAINPSIHPSRDSKVEISNSTLTSRYLKVWMVRVTRHYKFYVYSGGDINFSCVKDKNLNVIV